MNAEPFNARQVRAAVLFGMFVVWLWVFGPRLSNVGLTAIVIFAVLALGQLFLDARTIKRRDE